jgi:hypothetical protein
MGWNFLTEVLKIDKDRLYVSVFEETRRKCSAIKKHSIYGTVVPESCVLGNRSNFGKWVTKDHTDLVQRHIDIRTSQESSCFRF